MKIEDDIASKAAARAAAGMVKSLFWVFLFIAFLFVIGWGENQIDKFDPTQHLGHGVVAVSFGTVSLMFIISLLLDKIFKKK